jgi:hypothetical protein
VNCSAEARKIKSECEPTFLCHIQKFISDMESPYSPPFTEISELLCWFSLIPENVINVYAFGSRYVVILLVLSHS